jgi:signal transduction histidine kinase
MKMSAPKALLLICFLSASFATVCGQGKIADSLELRLKKAQGTERVDILNQLTYEFISINNEKVLKYSNEALTLSKKINYPKGQGIAHTYRGVFEYMTGQFPEAHQNLHMGIRISEKAGDRQNVGYSYLQLGNAGLEEVDNDSSLLYFTKALEILKDSSNPENLSKIYRNLSALYGQRFQQDSQQYYLDRAIAIRRLLPDKSLLSDALAIQANTKFRLGDIEGAETLLAEADQILKQNPSDLENLNDVKHIRALILFQKGKFEDAVVLFDSARNYYFRTALFRKYVTLLTDLGEIFSERGDYELALNNLYDALRLSRLRGFETETYIIRNRIGWVNHHLGDLNQALRLANESLNAQPKKVLVADLADALTLKGVVLTQLLAFSQAKVCLDSVLRIHQKANNRQGMSEAFMNIGALESEMKHYPKALELYKKSLDLAEEVKYTYGLAWSNWGTGDIYFKLGDYKKAATYLDRSEKYSRIIHAYELLIFNYNTRRDLLSAQNQFKESLKYSILASQLKDSIHHTDLARRFVNLEKIQEIEQRDRNIQILQNQKQIADDKIHLQESRLQQQYILLIAGLVSIALLAILVFIYYRFYSRIKLLNITITEKNKRIHAQASKLQEVNSELNRLYNELSEQNEEIQAQANDLAESNKNINDLNRDLERIVAEKTIELRRTNDELVKHNNELLQFSYTVSHNLRGPVARLLGLSSLVQTENELAQAKQWIFLIGKTASDLDLIIKDLSKILELRNEPSQYRDQVDLEQEWKQSVSLLQDSLTGEEEIIADFSAVPQLTTVRPMLQSIFYNLLSNAIKFRSPGRRLRIRAISKIKDSKVVIEISDNGLGMNTQLYKDKLFKLYTRFHSHVAGRGLGLYLVKSQVEVLHGNVEVESRPDQGTLFRITLPLITEEMLHRV